VAVDRRLVQPLGGFVQSFASHGRHKLTRDRLKCAGRSPGEAADEAGQRYEGSALG
jgi:hypothetical protein